MGKKRRGYHKISLSNLKLNLNTETLDKGHQISSSTHPPTDRRCTHWDRRSHRAAHDEVTGPEVLAVPLGVSEDGEGGVAGGVYAPQLLQGLAVLLQPLSRGLQAVWEGQGGEGGGRGELGLWEEWRGKKTEKFIKWTTISLLRQYM